MKRHGLSLAFGLLFVGTLVGQAFVGVADFNEAQIAHHGDPISLWRYVRSSEFGVDVLENWQSEYLQFSLFIIGTVWLLQRGSPESKELDNAGLESDEDQRVGEHAGPDSPKWARVGGWRTRIYSGLRRSRAPSTREPATSSRPPPAELDGRAGDLPAPARLAGVQARRRAALGDRRRGMISARRGR